MRSLISRICGILRDKRGESLVEGVVSVLVFSIAMLAVSTMLAASINVTNRQTALSREMQMAVNSAVFEDYPEDDIAAATFNLVEIDDDGPVAGGMNVSVGGVRVFGGMNFTAFMPPEPEGGK